MESFVMAAKVVMPMAMMVGIGVLFRIFGLADAPTMKKVDNMIFKVFMPMVSFYNIYKTDFTSFTSWGYILYGVVVLILLLFVAMFVVPKLVHPVPTAASYGQTLFRSNYLIFGNAVAESIYGAGNYGIVTLLGSIAVPLFNAEAAILLEKARNGSASGKKLMIAVVKNPTVIATIAGLVVNFSGLVLPEIVLDVVQDLAGLTTPLSFLSIGVTLSLGAVSQKKYLVSASVLRLVVLPVVFVSLGAELGFRGQELCALMILFAAPVAVSSYPMAAAMDADGEFAAQMVAYTTVFCLPTIFVFTLVLNALGWL